MILPNLLSNQFLSGGIVLLLSGGVMALLRNTPAALLNKIRNQIFISVSINQKDPLFEWITLWLADHPYSKKARFIVASTKDERGSVTPKIIFSPSRGEHFFFYQKKLIWLSRVDEDKSQQSGNSTTTPGTGLDEMLKQMQRRDVYVFRMLGRSQNTIRKLIDDILVATKSEREDKVSIYTTTYGWWEKLTSYTTRPLESVILPENKKENLVDDLRDFLANEEWYMKRGVPYRRGYLFFGPPGNGKTSLISALAGELKLNLYSLNLSNRSIGDGELARLVRMIRARSILLLEDVDAAIISRDPTPEPVSTKDTTQVGGTPDEQKGVTLSGLLNVLDGVLTPDGLLVIMTTNYPERLDSALIRPGRVDKRIEFTCATEDQKYRSFKWFYPDRSEEAAHKFRNSFNGNTSMATIQQKLIEMRKD